MPGTKETLADICARIRTIDESKMRDLDFMAVFLEFLPKDIEAAEMREREQKRKLYSELIARLEDKLAESVRKNELLRAKNIQLANDVEKANRKIERLSGNIASELKSALIEILDRTERSKKSEVAVKREREPLLSALSHCKQYAQKIERETEVDVTRLDAEEIIATIDNEFDGIRPSATGNASALRAALEQLLRFLQWMYAQEGRSADVGRDRLSDEIDVAVSALAAPPRNCDVGDAAEQSERLAKFCKANYEKAKKDKHICSECRFNDCLGECPLKWAQLPFTPEKGGAE